MKKSLINSKDYSPNYALYIKRHRQRKFHYLWSSTAKKQAISDAKWYASFGEPATVVNSATGEVVAHFDAK